MNIAIVGGGNAAVTILNHFSLFDSHQVIGIADLNADAPGVIRAQELEIDTTDDMMVLVRHPKTEIVFELTGNEKVQSIIKENLSDDQTMVCSDGAKIMCDLIEAQDAHKREITGRVSQEFEVATKQIESTVKSMKRSSRELKGLLKQGRMISINANIEAARIGEMGKAFSVVVTAIHDLVANMQNALSSIDDAAEKTKTTVNDLYEAEKQLTDTL